MLLVAIFSVLSMLLIFGCGQKMYADESASDDTAADRSADQTVAEEVPGDSTHAATETTVLPNATAAATKPKCGNGICEKGENCDSCYKDCACKSPAECYQAKCVVPECGGDGDCNDKDACTKDTCYFAQHPNAYCAHELPEKCGGKSDDCCPEGCNAGTDVDCEPVCGNKVCEPGEATESCEKDCFTECGNDDCEEGENKDNCSEDCGSEASCGNEICEDGEDKLNCDVDCAY